MYKALPFPDYIVVVRLTGAQLRKALEHGVSGPGPRGRFPQVSGLTFTYRPQAPPGRRVQQILVSGRPLEADKIYTVATNNFLAAGGDGYQVFAEALKPKVGRPARCGPGTTVREAVITYIKSQGKIAPAVEGRIRTLSGRQESFLGRREGAAPVPLPGRKPAGLTGRDTRGGGPLLTAPVAPVDLPLPPV